MKQNFGEQLKQWRESQDINTYSAAVICGMNWSNYSRIEEGNNVSIKNILRITKALKLKAVINNGIIKLK